MCTIIRAFCILPPQMKKAAHRVVPHQNEGVLARQRNLLFIARFRFLFPRYASALLLSMTLRKFIKATKKRFLFCIRSRPGFHCGNRSGSFCLLVLFQALTQSLARVLDGNLSGCQNYRAFGLTILRHLQFFSFSYPISAMTFSKFSSCK